jgi:hypothetical protein
MQSAFSTGPVHEASTPEQDLASVGARASIGALVFDQKEANTIYN